MKNLYLVVLFLLSMSSTVFAQQTEQCATNAILEQTKQRFPDMDIEGNQAAIEAFTQRYIEQQKIERSPAEIITIPVVVHIVYKQASENISDEQIQSQIDVLNEDFRRLNADASNTPAAFEGVAADTEIEFCLAAFTPTGIPTDGIVRKQTTRDEFSVSNGNFVKKAFLGGSDAWNTDEYLNIWVCNFVDQVLGFATFPGTAADGEDGVVVGHKYFGSAAKGSFPVLQSPYNLGRTATHEVGHYLNLRHIWGDGDCSADDMVDDTPVSDESNFQCKINEVSCGTTDMVQNYMDYSNDACMNLYTQGQKDRMRALFAIGGARAALGQSAASNCNVSSVHPLDVASQFTISPNPTNDVVNIDLSFAQSREAVTVSIYDIHGKMIQQKVLSNVENDRLSFDLSNTTKGVYFVTLQSNTYIATQKLILI